MERITSTEILEREIESCTKALQAKLNGEGGKRAVCVCGGTGCIANSSLEIEEELRRLIKENGLEDRVTVNHVGCFGFCSQGPFVKIFPEDTLYRAVKLTDLEQIVKTDLIEGKVCENLLYVDPVTKEKVVRQDDINFYK